MKKITSDIPWYQEVYEIVRLIPKGKVTTYGHIAELIGMRGGARMIGWAMNKSHMQSPAVPAHRVVNRKGLLTGKMHFEHERKMQELLEREGIHVLDDQIQNFEQHIWQPEIENLD